MFQVLPVRSIPFIGRSLANRLGKSIKTVEDFRRLSFFSLDRLIGKNATTLWLELHGVDVWKMSHTEGKQKSILRSRSFNHAMTDNKHVLWKHFLENFEKAYDELVSLECEALSISVLLRSKELSRRTETHTFDTPTIDKHLFLQTAKVLLEQVFELGTMYRSTGVVFSNLSPANPKQLSVFEYDNVTSERNVKLQKTIHQIQDRYGRSLIKLGRL